jgi:hypothetical protein
MTQVPSHTARLIEKVLDMMGENKEGHYLPPGVHFKDKRGNFAFRDAVRAYLLDFTCRASANVLFPHGGGAGSNNATEAQNKTTHQHCPIRKPPVAHLLDMMQHVHTCSVADTAFDARMRRDLWHHDGFVAVDHLRNFVPYPNCPSCSFNVMDCSFVENIMIERLLPEEMVYTAVPGEAEHVSARIVDFKTAMKPVRTKCLLLLTYATLQTIVNNHPKIFELHKHPTSAQVVQSILNFLSSKTADDRPSWKDQFIRFMNMPAALALEDMKLSEWHALTHSFAVLVPLIDDPDIARYLGRLEEGVPIDSVDSKRQGNGCVINWSKVPDTGIYYCLCADHALRGICLHILLWLVTKGIITPPEKWSAVRIAGPNTKGRDRHYVDGSALLRDTQPSAHALAKIAKHLQDPRVHADTKQALVSCKGTICLQTDSIRKYAEKHYKYGMAKAPAGTRKRTPSKRRKPAGRASSRAHSSEETSSASDQVSDECEGAGKHAGKRKKPCKGSGRGKQRGANTSAGQKARGKRAYIDESAGADTDHGCEEDDNGLAGSRFVRKQRTLTASERASNSAAKYVAVIRTARMTVKAKIDLMEIMLVSESDGALKSVIEECLEEDMSLQELARVLEEPGSGE